MKFRGRLRFRVYNPMKPVKYGLKSYVLSDSETGYCWALEPYCGESSPVHETVLRLLGDLSGHGYHLYMDNWYTSVRVAECLLRKKTHLTGTLRRHQGAGPEINNLGPRTMEKGATLMRHCNDIMLMAWQPKPNKLLRMISTGHHDTMEEVQVRERGRRARVTERKPTCVLHYNRKMNGVDKLDQHIGYYPFCRKFNKWTTKFGFYLLQIALYNAFVLYRANNSRGLSKHTWTSSSRLWRPGLARCPVNGETQLRKTQLKETQLRLQQVESQLRAEMKLRKTQLRQHHVGMYERLI